MYKCIEDDSFLGWWADAVDVADFVGEAVEFELEGGEFFGDCLLFGFEEDCLFG